MSLVKVNAIVHPSGTANNISLDSSGNITFANTVAVPSGNVYPIVTSTSQATTSGTSIDYTGIPSWVKRITVMVSGVSTNGSSHLLVQIGAGSVQTTGYISTTNGTNQSSATGGASATNGFIFRRPNGASGILSGHMILTLVGSNAWVSSHVGKDGTTEAVWGAGDVTLSGTLDRVRITTVNGTDVFDAGIVNIMYE